MNPAALLSGKPLREESITSQNVDQHCVWDADLSELSLSLGREPIRLIRKNRGKPCFLRSMCAIEIGGWGQYQILGRDRHGRDGVIHRAPSNGIRGVSSNG